MKKLKNKYIKCFAPGHADSDGEIRPPRSSGPRDETDPQWPLLPREMLLLTCLGLCPMMTVMMMS